MPTESNRPSPDTTPEQDDAPLAEDEEIGPRATTGKPEGLGDDDPGEGERS